MKIIGLTGGIASGKSTVSQQLTQLNIPVIDADKIAREVVEPGQPALQKIKETFGEEFFLEDGTLDRPKLGQRVFGDEAARKQLNKITHPAIQNLMIKRMMGYFFTGYRMVVLDVPLLFESRVLLKICSNTVCVYCNADQELERLMRRDKLGREDAEKRIGSQMPLEDKARESDYIIDNTGDLETLKERVEELVATVTPTFIEAHGVKILVTTLVIFVSFVSVRKFVFGG
ncbi:dephospho-CoA kinase [Sphaeroforma arctica JP610]|uniref:Dephospho-CoA kinase n=1 Tax=Sphaeroforma arctica JP610 TaxID=667725 RepID=A0A0L0GD16_9EUKA|nr:dephospho-CoA kinase [Sphaeroforma arctica JP610]KNC86804.1 dephospho-CoA kinase [Sphaeroforma arctica JP610]|eukprot:XP_014160706.1 dephospho-CoA kinase [Sphaeroforma arctica JP610]